MHENAPGSMPLQLIEGTTHNLEIIKKINEVALSIEFRRSFYETALQNVGMVHLVQFYNMPVGAIIMKYDRENVHIYTLAVLPNYRRRGAGALLLGEARKAAHKHGMKRIVVNVWSENKTGINFLENHGFHRVALSNNVFPQLPTSTGWNMICDL